MGRRGGIPLPSTIGELVMETAPHFGEEPENEANDAIGNAEAAVAALADSFLGWIAEDISNERNSLEDAKACPKTITTICSRFSASCTTSRVREARSA